MVEWDRKQRKPTRPETPAARLSARPPAPEAHALSKTAHSDAGRYAKRLGDVTAALSVKEQGQLAALRDEAPQLAQLIADSTDTDQVRQALRELELLLRRARTSRPPRR